MLEALKNKINSVSLYVNINVFAVNCFSELYLLHYKKTFKNNKIQIYENNIALIPYFLQSSYIACIHAIGK